MDRQRCGDAIGGTIDAVEGSEPRIRTEGESLDKVRILDDRVADLPFDGPRSDLLLLIGSCYCFVRLPKCVR